MATKDKTQETEDFQLEDEPAADAAAAPSEGEGTKANDQNPPASKKDPLPDGWETPTAFAHRLTDLYPEYSKENPFKPQMVYGYVKNGKDFPKAIHSDGRFIVEIEPALAWIEANRAKRAERQAKKAAAEAAAAEAAKTEGETAS